LQLGLDALAFTRSVEIGRKFDSEPFKACKAITELSASLDASFKKKSAATYQRYSALANLLAQRLNPLWAREANLLSQFDRQHK
jgi:hypothetical protein